MWLRRAFLAFAIVFFATASIAEDQEIKLVAAGSLTDAFNAMIADYGKTHPVHFKTVWGPSGTLRDALEKGEPFDIFASAALKHAETLSDESISTPSALFVRNALIGSCIVCAAQLIDCAGRILEARQKIHVVLGYCRSSNRIECGQYCSIHLTSPLV